MLNQGSTRRQILRGAGAGAAGLLAGCLGGGSDDDELHIMTDYTGDAWEEHWDTLISSWEEDHDVPVNKEEVGFQGTGEQRLATLMQSGNPPEMFHGTAPEVGDLINTGRTMPVDDVVDDLEDEWGDSLFRNTLQPIGDETHMIPHGVYMGGTLNYRDDIYEDLDLDVPETWDELVENARAIDEADIEHNGEKVHGWALPAQPSGKSASDFANWLYNAGGDVWMPGTEDDPELWLDEDHVMEVFDLLQELAQYSPDPSSLDWGTTIEYWTAGRIGQCIMNNAWLCGPAIANGLTEHALNTEQALIPKLEGAEPLQRGWVLADGTPIIEGSSNPEDGKDFNRMMYGPEHGPATSLVEPLRFIPPYEGIMESEEYQSAEVFQMEDGAFLEKNRFCLEEIAPELESDETITTPETLQVNVEDIPGQMTNRLIIEEQDPQDVYEWGVEEYQSQLEDAQSQSNY